MPLRIADLAKTEKAVTFQYDGEDVTVVYRPKLLTTMTRLRLLGGPSLSMENVNEATPAEWLPAVEGYFDEIAALLVSWDVLDEKGKALKPTAQLLADLPQDFVGSVLRAIVEASNAGPQSGEVLPATSPPTD